ncbi:hypothetical protein D3C72_1882550 [compost metagenome]
MLHDANILNATLTGQLQQGANAGLVHLAAQEVVLRPQAGDMRGGLTHAEADLKDRRRLAAKCCLPVQWLRCVRHHHARPDFVDGTLLPGRGPPRAAHERTDPARMRNAFRIGRRGGGRLSGAVYRRGVVSRRRFGAGVLGKHGNKKAAGQITVTVAKAACLDWRWSGRWESNPRL